MKTLIIALSLVVASFAQAKVEVLFHPHDPTLEQISQWIMEAESTVDIAMYNMETGSSSPVIQALKSPDVQARLHSGQLQMRLLFEGYGTPEENSKKMAALEELGLDVRFLGKVVKVHHKFAVMDAGLRNHRVVTGSANWSLSSYRNYNENILFFTQESEATSRYQQEFNRLWDHAQEFGVSTATREVAVPAFRGNSNLEIFFNSPRTLKQDLHEAHRLTDQVVRLINEAKNEIFVASARVRLKPVLEALLQAGERGVKVYILVSQDDFMDIGRRAQWLLMNKNIQVRVKFYDLRVANYMTYQMHNKFMIVDQERMVSGSFNWSESSENKHIENLVELGGRLAQDVIPSYVEEFVALWDLGRADYPTTLEKVTQDPTSSCALAPMSLNVSEVRKLLKVGKNCQ